MFCWCNTIHYDFLLKIQPYMNKMRTILRLIQNDFLRSRLSDFYNKITWMEHFFSRRLKNAHISSDWPSYLLEVHLSSPDFLSDLHKVCHL